MQATCALVNLFMADGGGRPRSPGEDRLSPINGSSSSLRWWATLAISGLDGCGIDVLDAVGVPMRIIDAHGRL
jgi:hypothetical protein